MEVTKTQNYKDKLIEKILNENVQNNDNNEPILNNNMNKNPQNNDYLNITKNKSTKILDDRIKITEQELINKGAQSKENFKYNYKTFDPKKEDIFKLSEIDENSELGRKEEENNLKNMNHNKFNSKEKLKSVLNENQVYIRDDSFMQKSFKINSNEVVSFEKTKYYSEKILTNSKKYFQNLQELISKKINSRKEEKLITRLNGDTNQVLPFWIGMDLQIEKDLNIKKNNIDQENKEVKSKENLKCLTYREEATKTLVKFEEDFMIEDKNNAMSECNENENFIEKMEGNQYEMNGNEIIPVKMHKVSNNEGYYELNNKLNFYSVNGGKDDQPKINNEYLKNEVSHQVTLNQFQQSIHNNSANSNFNSYSGDDYLITKENLTSKGFFRIDTNNTSIIKLPENYWTKDIDKKILVDLINENPTAKWDKIKIENNPSILIKTIATINGFKMEEIFNAIANVDIRQKWDTLFSEFKIVEQNKEEKSEVLYMSLKSPFVLVERRDFVQRRKIWHDFPDKNSVCIHFKSIDHPLCPLYKKIVRAHTYISGYFIKTESLNPPKCSVHIISQTDVKGKIPVWIVNKVSQTAPNDWVNNLIRGCKMVREKSLVTG